MAAFSVSSNATAWHGEGNVWTVSSAPDVFSTDYRLARFKFPSINQSGRTIAAIQVQTYVIDAYLVSYVPSRQWNFYVTTNASLLPSQTASMTFIGSVEWDEERHGAWLNLNLSNLSNPGVVPSFSSDWYLVISATAGAYAELNGTTGSYATKFTGATVDGIVRTRGSGAWNLKPVKFRKSGAWADGQAQFRRSGTWVTGY